MVKLKRNKLKELNKLTKKHNASPTNKILKKKRNLEKKVTFQKELLEESVKNENLVKSVKPKADILKKVSKTPEKETKKTDIKNKKLKPVEKKKKRQKTQVYDTKLILNLMKSKFNVKGEMQST